VLDPAPPEREFRFGWKREVRGDRSRLLIRVKVSSIKGNNVRSADMAFCSCAVHPVV
jgi:hypothetical protein